MGTMATGMQATTADIEEEDDIESQVIRTSVTRKANTKIISKTRYIKLVNTFIFLIAVVFILLFATKHSTGFHLVAYVIALLYLIGGIYFLSIILGSNSLHSIVVWRQSLNGFHNFVIPECTLSDHTQTIKSVSAVTA